MLTIETHPLLDLAALAARFPRPLAELPSPPWLVGLLSSTATAPMVPDEAVRLAVRDVLRPFGYKPTGRGKPSSEYLARAAADGSLGTINLAVDLGNAVSLHSGVPISVVDLDRLRPPLRVAVAAAGQSYAFNAAAQVIDVAGLPCLTDEDGPCANAVKDAQRSKTGLETCRVLCLIWGARSQAMRTSAAAAWLHELLARAGAAVEEVRS